MAVRVALKRVKQNDLLRVLVRVALRYRTSTVLARLDLSFSLKWESSGFAIRIIIDAAWICWVRKTAYVKVRTVRLLYWKNRTSTVRPAYALPDPSLIPAGPGSSHLSSPEPAAECVQRFLAPPRKRQRAMRTRTSSARYRTRLYWRGWI